MDDLSGRSVFIILDVAPRLPADRGFSLPGEGTNFSFCASFDILHGGVFGESIALVSQDDFLTTLPGQIVVIRGQFRPIGPEFLGLDAPFEPDEIGVVLVDNLRSPRKPVLEKPLRGYLQDVV